MKWRFAIPVALFAVLCGVFGWMLYRTGAQGYDTRVLESPLIGKRAPTFRLPRVENMEQMVDTSDYAGKAYLLNVWATWCVECRHEHPVLLEIARQNIIPIIGLDTKDDLADAQRWLNALGNPYVATAFDAEGRTALDWGVYGAPETFLIDADGNVAYRHVGTLTMNVWQQHFLPRIQPKSQAAGGGS
jgi:cytochrome c biogenesis protein CcmG/thiol:disulfide interchange protein DsbE